MTTTHHTDVLPFLAITEATVRAPHQVTDYLDRLDDATLEAVRVFGDYLARGATAVQEHRRFEQMWQEAAAPVPIGAETAAVFVAALAGLATTEPAAAGHQAVDAEPDAAPDLANVDPARDRVEPSAALEQDDPAAVTAVIPAIPAGLPADAATATDVPWPHEPTESVAVTR